MLRRFWWSPLLCIGLSACHPTDPGRTPAAADPAAALAADGDHMVSINAADAPPAPAAVKPARDAPWPEVVLENGKVWVSCDADYTGDAGDGPLLEALDRETLDAALEPCRERGLVRVRYAGKINPSFATLVTRLAVVADAMKIGKRILDLDSSGGQVEAAIVAGDSIGDAGWTIWVREGSICHSACVFVLAAGDNRLISGKVGIHRMMRISSTATSRAELNRELQEVYGNVKDYLQRNGVAVGVADLMMTVPNRSLRLLGSEELKQYGLDGTNAVQDDLERIKQMRKCGDDFVRRKDAFLIAFDRQCKLEGSDLETVTTCGQALKEHFGFPDETCPDESPLSEIDTALLAMPAEPLPALAPAEVAGEQQRNGS
ncbi:hypothetical protein [Stenotrophomonas mori]|uniref:Secreted protein n=1 Tax=Stenotrophomonas mori TaxID=2871096 RepID=A0ABT0SG83_9GAMM|nr:hypothetical protein [Stenotrophomonas mori]MCL7714331.1 hypothetical protein [Stenotrophomonas mori]